MGDEQAFACGARLTTRVECRQWISDDGTGRIRNHCRHNVSRHAKNRYLIHAVFAIDTQISGPQNPLIQFAKFYVPHANTAVWPCCIDAALSRKQSQKTAENHATNCLLRIHNFAKRSHQAAHPFG